MSLNLVDILVALGEETKENLIENYLEGINHLQERKLSVINIERKTYCI